MGFGVVDDRTSAEPLLACMAPKGDEQRRFVRINKHTKVFKNLKGGLDAVDEPLKVRFAIKLPGLQNVVCKESEHGFHPGSAGGLLDFFQDDSRHADP